VPTHAKRQYNKSRVLIKIAHKYLKKRGKEKEKEGESERDLK